MSDNYSADGTMTCENKRNATRIVEEAKSAIVSEPSLKFLQLVSIFESEENTVHDTRLKCEFLLIVFR